MPALLFNRSAQRPTRPKAPAKRSSGRNDPGYIALTRLRRLRDDLLSVSIPLPSRWKEPPLFFFDRAREAERQARCPAHQAEHFAAVTARITEEMPLLCGSVEARRVARTIDGLRSAAETLAPMCKAATVLLELLAVPDDEVILVLHPDSRIGLRMCVRGVADVGQFHVLMAAAFSGDPALNTLEGKAIPDRFVIACRNSGPAIPAGIPMVMEARFQFYTAAALRPDGSVPSGFGACRHWLWPDSPLATLPRLNGERTILIGPPAYRANWHVQSRFPEMPADTRLLESLGPFRVAEQLSRLTGNTIPPLDHRDVERKLSKAA
jgi:hypothetical protein